MITQPVIEDHQGLKIIRDDLLPGGSKRRALLRWLPEFANSHFEYVGTVFGSGACALAKACTDLGFTCTLHFSKSKYQPHWLDGLNCEIIWHEAQPVEDILKRVPDALPLGFNHPGFIYHMRDIFQENIPLPKQIWLPCVGGTLLQAAREAWPQTDLRAVRCARFSPHIEGVINYDAPEKYHQPAKISPPYPACPFSDAKLWQFTQEFALTDAYVWNTSS